MNEPEEIEVEVSVESDAPVSIPFPDAVAPELKDGDAYEGMVKGTIQIVDGEKRLLVETLNEEPVGANMDQIEGEEEENDEDDGETITAEDALDRFVAKNNKGKGIQ